MSTRARTDALRGEFGPWVALVEVAVEAAADPGWAAAARAVTLEGVRDAPALAGATIPVDGRAVRRLVERIFTAARWRRASQHPARWLAAGVAGDRAALEAIAAEIDRPPAAVAPLAELIALPLLLACGRRFGDRGEGWTRGDCPICGAWPMLAELRGLERARRLRCRCGADWAFLPLLCPFCGNDDHQRLTSLVPESGGESRRIDACEDCRGYVKAVAQLGAIPPESLPLEDLATVELDLAALERGYQRPERERALEVRIRVEG